MRLDHSFWWTMWLQRWATNTLKLFFTQTTIRLFTFSMVECSVTKSCPTLRLHGLYPARLLCPWNSPVSNTGVGCNFLLQGIFPTQGSNPSLLPWQADSLPLSHLRSLWLSYCIWKLFPISPSKLGNAQLNCELLVSLWCFVFWCFLKKKKKLKNKAQIYSFIFLIPLLTKEKLKILMWQLKF